MTPDRWQRVKEVFTRALEHPAESITAFVATACGSDLELHTEVNRLLVQHFETGPFLEHPLPRVISIGLVDSTHDEIVLDDTRFEMRGRLGAGGFGNVFEVYDKKLRSSLALKYLRRFDPDQLYRLKQEFRTLVDLRHPNLIQVHELFSSTDPPFFTMELLKGVDLREHLRSTGHLLTAGQTDAYTRFRAYLLQLCEGLLALHEAHLVHRDVKPTNVFLTDAGRVVLLDFGLVKQLGTAISTVGIAGTPQYLSPEQLKGEELTYASDWYAVGVLLFEAMTGRLPFEGDMVQVLSQKCQDSPPSPRSLAPAIPSDLSDLCHRLLRPDPRLRPTGAEVVQLLRSTATTSPAADQTHDRVRASTVHVARQVSLQTLHEALHDADGNETVAVHVRGPAGTGKTALIRGFLEIIQDTRPDCVVLRGRCYENESAPYKGLDQLIDRLAVFLKGLGALRVESLLPAHFPTLARMFPVLQQFAGTGPRGEAGAIEQKQRAFDCLRELLARVAKSAPLVLWIDDLQWCDPDTIQFLKGLARSADPFKCLVLLSYRDDALHSSPDLRDLEAIGDGGPMRSIRQG